MKLTGLHLLLTYQCPGAKGGPAELVRWYGLSRKRAMPMRVICVMKPEARCAVGSQRFWGRIRCTGWFEGGVKEDEKD